VKGQYFSFDAVVAAVIMVIAVTSLVTYWFGVQSVTESRSSDMYADSLRIAESLLSPGSPPNWNTYAPSHMDQVQQIGLEENGGELDEAKITTLQEWADYPASWTAYPPPSGYTGVGNIMRATGDYYIVIQQTDGSLNYLIGRPPAANASEVEIAHRGAVLDNGSAAIPVQITVYLWTAPQS
jgi:hypothetical protein